jgi:cysteine synthase A
MSEHHRGLDLFETIGRTPLVRLAHIGAGGPPIAAKLETTNPSGSLKDRIYHEMIERAVERGDLRPGMTILECSTGNAGISCAFVGARMGYPVIIVMPGGMSEERKKLIRAYGATIVETPGGESDVDLALAKLQEMKKAEPGRYWEPAQFSNPDNTAAHYRGTGPEVWDQTGGEVDVFVASQGTGGTLTGVGRYLKERNPKVKLFAVEPAECPLLSRRTWGSHRIEGIGDGFVPRNLDLAVLDGVVTTTSDESIRMAQRLAREEGLFCGISTGCNIAAALKVAARFPQAKLIVTMINDTGQRYFSTALCGEKKQIEVPEREHPMDAYTKEQLDVNQPRWILID